jgi:hypothetical protein
VLSWRVTKFPNSEFSYGTFYVSQFTTTNKILFPPPQICISFKRDWLIIAIVPLHLTKLFSCREEFVNFRWVEFTTHWDIICSMGRMWVPWNEWFFAFGCEFFSCSFAST